MIPALQLLLALAYAALAHFASLRAHDGLALAALGVLVAMLLVEPLLQRRTWAFVLLPFACAGAWWLYRAGHAALPLLLVPVVFVLAIGWLFARTLRAGSVPLISRIVIGMEGGDAAAVPPALHRYTRSLTAAWAGVLLGLAAVNLLLALLATPGGLLDSVGIASPWPITREQWSWIANLLGYGVVGGFFALEFMVRQRRFPGRYRNFADFVRKLARLEPAFWRGLLR